MECTHAGATLTCNTDIPEEEARAYIDYLQDKHGAIATVEVTIDGDYADLNYTCKDQAPFERIRRITGYLVGTLDRFNDAKRAEESQRVKHEVPAGE